MNKKIKMGIGIGGPSILMIFVVLSLTTLGTLALMTANADYKLTKKTADSVSSYYVADSQGEEFLALVDESLAASPNSFGTEKSTVIPISDTRSLHITLKLPGENGKRYSIASWKIVNNTQWDYTEFEIQYEDTVPL